jgi:hypothetical protein
MPTCEGKFDMIEEDPRGKRNGPKFAETNSGPNPITLLEVGLMPRIVPEATDNPADELKKHAVAYLELTRKQGESFAQNRTYYSGLAKKYGLTNQEIGDILGITEARVRQLVAGS